jgi:hypothetical protein
MFRWKMFFKLNSSGCLQWVYCVEKVVGNFSGRFSVVPTLQLAGDRCIAAFLDSGVTDLQLPLSTWTEFFNRIGRKRTLQ